MTSSTRVMVNACNRWEPEEAHEEGHEEECSAAERVSDHLGCLASPWEEVGVPDVLELEEEGWQLVSSDA
jgi:hypothetical protein